MFDPIIEFYYFFMHDLDNKIFVFVVFFLGLCFGWFFKTGSIFKIILGIVVFSYILSLIMAMNTILVTLPFVLGFFGSDLASYKEKADIEMNQTELLFMMALFLLIGAVIGKFFKSFHPLYMIFGLIIAGAIFQNERFQNPYLYAPFGIGFLYTWFNPFRMLYSFFTGTFETLQFSALRFFQFQRRKNQLWKREEQVRSREEKLRDYEDELRREKEELKKEWERIKREWEELRREREAHYREQQRQNKEQYQEQTHENKGSESREQAKEEPKKKPSEKKQTRYFKEFAQFDLDRFERNDPYEVLGIRKNAGMREIITAYRKLQMKYHPDRFRTTGNLDELKEANSISALLNWAYGKIL